MKTGKKFFKSFKKDIDEETHKVADKISETGETIETELKDVGETLEKKSRMAGMFAKFQIGRAHV